MHSVCASNAYHFTPAGNVFDLMGTLRPSRLYVVSVDFSIYLKDILAQSNRTIEKAEPDPVSYGCKTANIVCASRPCSLIFPAMQSSYG